MGEILVRYSCDGCNRLAANEDDFTTVEERYYVGNDDSYGLRSRKRLYCKPCLQERQYPEGRYGFTPVDVGLDRGY